MIKNINNGFEILILLCNVNAKSEKNFQNDVSCCFITIFLSKLKSSNVTPLEVKKAASKSLIYNDFFDVFFIFLILFDLFEIVNQN